MNLATIAEEKARELLEEMAQDLPYMTLHAITQLAFMRGAAWEARAANEILDRRIKAGLEWPNQ